VLRIQVFRDVTLCYWAFPDVLQEHGATCGADIYVCWSTWVGQSGEEVDRAWLYLGALHRAIPRYVIKGMHTDQ